MRLFTFIVSALFVAIGVVMIADGDPIGWWVAGFFALCLLVAIFEPRLPKRHLRVEYRLVITADDIACEHPRRKRESIRWDDVVRICYVTTPGGPYLPDEWFLLESADGGCSFPTEVEAMGQVWDELEERFPGFDYGPIIEGSKGKWLCWERRPES